MAKQTKTNQYEAMFLFGTGAATEPAAAEAHCRRFIETHGGQISVLKKWDERKLAYEVAGNKRGTYFLALFNAPSTAVASIERDVKLSEDVLRVMILKADDVNAEEIEKHEPQKPEPREERGFGFGGGFGGGGFGGGDRGDRGGYGGGGGGGDRGERQGDRPGFGGPRGPRRDENAPEGANAGGGDDR